MKKHKPLLIQFLKFGTVGALGFIVDTGFLYFGIDVLHLRRIAAGLFSFPFAVTFTWFGNRNFTFPHARRERKTRQWAKFFVVCAVGLVFNRGTYSLLVSNSGLFYKYPVLGLAAGTLVAMFFNFFAAKQLVFARK